MLFGGVRVGLSKFYGALLLVRLLSWDNRFNQKDE